MNFLKRFAALYVVLMLMLKISLNNSQTNRIDDEFIIHQTAIECLDSGLSLRSIDRQRKVKATALIGDRINPNLPIVGPNDALTER